jgi:hypothetical protein
MKVPNSRLTWAQWIAYQAANPASTQFEESVAAHTLPARPGAVGLLARGTKHDALAHLAWQLPATKALKGRLTWAEWLTMQAESMGLEQPQQAAPERAA